MPIARLTACHVRIPLKRPIRHASHARSDTDSLIVRCELTDGTTGWGEGLPREYVTGETIDDAWSLLQAVDLAEQLAGDFSDPTSAVTSLSSIVFPNSPPSTLNPQPSTIARGCFGNSVRCAIEIAILDAVCRTAGVPLSHITSLLPETRPLRQQANTVRYSGILTAQRPLAQLHSAIKQRVYGFRQIKVKVGLPGSEDLALLRRVRRIVGRKVALRIDANEAWDCDSLIERLSPLTDLGICSVEQPVPHAKVAGLAELRDELPVDVMLDESLCSTRDALRAIDEGLCEMFNIRLSKCGGFLPSLRIAALAHQAGLGYQLGCQVGETGILSAAGRHFACSLAGLQALEGSYDRHLVRQRLTVEDITFGYGGVAPALTQPGLGITIDESSLRQVTQRTHQILG